MATQIAIWAIWAVFCSQPFGRWVQTTSRNYNTNVESHFIYDWGFRHKEIAMYMVGAVDDDSITQPKLLKELVRAWPAYLPACMHAWPTYVPACLPTCLRAWPAYLPTLATSCLPACLERERERERERARERDAYTHTHTHTHMHACTITHCENGKRCSNV